MANHRNPTSEQWRRLYVEFQEAFNVNDLQVLIKWSFNDLKLEMFVRIDTVGNCVQDLFGWANMAGTWVALDGARGMRPHKRPFVVLCEDVIASLKGDASSEDQPEPEKSVLMVCRLPQVAAHPIALHHAGPPPRCRRSHPRARRWPWTDEMGRSGSTGATGGRPLGHPRESAEPRHSSTSSGNPPGDVPG